MDALKNVQHIRVGKERAVVVPLGLWELLMEQLQDGLDAKLYDEHARPAPGDRDAEAEETVELDELCRRCGRSPLKYLRGLSGLTQKELAAKAGLSQAFIALVEKNKKCLSKSSRKRVARALGLSEEKLIC